MDMIDRYYAPININISFFRVSIMAKEPFQEIGILSYMQSAIYIYVPKITPDKAHRQNQKGEM
jgi:hypothetical protein